MAALAENPPPGGVCGLIIGYLVIAFTKTFSIMKKYSVFLLTIAPTMYANRIYLTINIVRASFDFSILQSA